MAVEYTEVCRDPHRAEYNTDPHRAEYNTDSHKVAYKDQYKDN